MIGAIQSAFPKAQRYLDVGAGSGAFAAHVASTGLSIEGCEYSPHGQRYAAKHGVALHPALTSARISRRQSPAPSISPTASKIAEH